MLKMACFFLFTFVLTFLPSNGFASLLHPSPGEQKILGVTIAPAAVFEQDGKPISLTSVGAGLRTKHIVFVDVNVYVGHLFVSDAATFKKDQPLDSLAQQKVVAFQLSFLRDVESSKIREALEESFRINEVPLDEKSVAAFVDQVKKMPVFRKNQSFTLVGFQRGDKDVLQTEDAQGGKNEIVAEKGFVRKIFSLWLGKTTEAGALSMQKEILK